MAARLEGQAVYDLKGSKFVSFDILALATRWGGNAYNGRFNDPDFGPAPMGVALTLANDSGAEQVEPLFFSHYGWRTS